MYAPSAEVHAHPETHGYPESLRKRAAEMYVDGGNLRRIARHLKVSLQTVSLGCLKISFVRFFVIYDDRSGV